MYLTMKQRIYWSNMYTDVRNYVTNCETCKTAKADNHPVKAKIHCREVPPEIFQRVHIDHLKISVKEATHGFTHALVMIDAMSLCCEIIPVKSTSAAETCRVLLREWIARYGVFSELVTDRHGAFTGKLTKLLLEWCGIRHVLISPYHSRSNGQVEKMNSIVLQGLRIHCKGLTEWHKMLAPIAAAYKAAVIPSRGVSPFKLMFGVDMRLPVETALTRDMPAHKRLSENAEIMSKQLVLMRQQAQTLAQSRREQGAKTANKGKHSYEFKPGDRVYKVRDVLGNADDHKTASKFQGPYVILEKGTNDVYKLANFYTGKIMKNFVHVDKLRSCQSTRAAKNKTDISNIVSMQTRKYRNTDSPRKRRPPAKSAARPQPRRTAGSWRRNPGGGGMGERGEIVGTVDHADDDLATADNTRGSECGWRSGAAGLTDGERRGVMGAPPGECAAPPWRPGDQSHPTTAGAAGAPATGRRCQAF